MSDQRRFRPCGVIAAALASAMVLAVAGAGYAQCVYPDQYLIRRDDMTIDYAATLECVASFEAETEQQIQDANDQLEKDLESIGTGTVRSRRGRRIYNMARLRTEQVEAEIAALRETMAAVRENTAGFDRLAATEGAGGERKIIIIRPADTELPARDEVPAASRSTGIQIIRPPGAAPAASGDDDTPDEDAAADAGSAEPEASEVSE